MDRLHCILREYRIRMSGIRNLLLNIGFKMKVAIYEIIQYNKDGSYLTSINGSKKRRKVP